MGQQDALFDLGPRAYEDAETRTRRLNRERQTQWRRRHQFVAPASEAPTDRPAIHDDGDGDPVLDDVPS